MGDFCRFGDKIGTVEEIGLRATKIRTLAQTAVYVPNSAFADMQLENFAARERIWYRTRVRKRTIELIRRRARVESFSEAG